MEISSVSTDAYTRISTGIQINSAADSPAGLSIVSKMESQTAGLKQGIENTASMNDLSKTAEGALDSINENLGRIRELAVSASNGILTDSDKSIIQGEIDELKKGITDVAKNTEFNTIKLLDGSFADKETAINPDGTGKQISISSATLENLGIEDFDVTGSFDISTIDGALEQVSESRSSLGSISNAFDHAISNSQNSVINLTSAKSNIEDADIVLEVSNMKREKILEQYKQFTQQLEVETQKNALGVLSDFKV